MRGRSIGSWMRGGRGGEGDQGRWGRVRRDGGRFGAAGGPGARSPPQRPTSARTGVSGGALRYASTGRAIVASMRRWSFVRNSATVDHVMWLKWFVSK